MSPTTIPLAHGAPALSQKLQEYFTGVFQAEDSGQEFPINLEHVWRIGYKRKDAAVRTLRKKFVQDVDFQSVHQIVQREVGAVTEEIFHLSVSCLEYFVVRANREVFEIYRACRKAVRSLVQPFAVPVPVFIDFSNPGIAARAWADEYDAKQLAQAETAKVNQLLIEAQPKVLFFDAVASAVNAVPMALAAKVLKLPGIGRNKLFQLLREDQVLQRNNTPYQHQIDQGHFEVELLTYATSSGADKLVSTTRVTGKGLEWMAGRYSAAA